jgi:hypothetical protein
VSGLQAKSIRTLHTEKLKKREKKHCRKLMFPKDSFRARICQKLITQSNSKSKICKHIIESQVNNEHKFLCR